MAIDVGESHTLRVQSVYMPHCEYSDEVVEAVYEALVPRRRDVPIINCIDGICRVGSTIDKHVGGFGVEKQTFTCKCFHAF